MYNRYQGNTGRVERVDDGDRHSSHGPAPPQPRPGPAPPQPGRGPHPGPPQSSGKLPIFDMLGGILPSRLQGLETEDLMLLLILYLMYRESGDKEMLIIMGAMFLL